MIANIMLNARTQVRREKRRTLLPVYLKGLVAGKYTLKQAAESTGYSVVHLCQLKKRYLNEGWSCLEHKNKYRVPVNKIPETERQRIAMIYASDFQDVNFSYYQKCLEDIYKIKVSWPTLKAILSEYGQVSPEARTRKHKRPAKRYRIRRECEGDLLQIDGTPYPWFYKSGDKKRYCIMGAIDDATGKITGLWMSKFECLYGYMEMLRTTCLTYGVPRQIYSDRAAIFCVTIKRDNGVSRFDQLAELHSERTQWQRILRELNIDQVLAWSPEAKGRVERMWRTVQGQLPEWLYLRGIKTVEAANKHLMEYAEEFNKSYGKAPAVDDSFYIDAPENLDEILQCRISRRTNSVGIISFYGTKFEVMGCKDRAYKDIEVCISERGVFACVNGLYYSLRCLDDNCILDTKDSNQMSGVLREIIQTYLFSYAKEVSI